jgi:hypothetical protein
MTDDELLAQTRDRMMVSLAFYFPMKKASETAIPEASDAVLTPIKNGDERDES